MKNILILIFIFALFGTLPYACNKTADQNNTTTTTASADDQKIKSEVKDRIDKDDSLDSAKIDVESDNAVVSLNGTVNSRAQEEQALVIAQNVPGVRTVRSHLKMEATEGSSGAGSQGSEAGSNLSERAKETGEKVEEAVSDAGITTKVKMKFAEDSQVSALNIDVTTKDGVVSLKGDVKSQAEADRAIELTRTVDGVRSVRSDLVVKSNS
jgi:hyperosmotically inducible protein